MEPNLAAKYNALFADLTSRESVGVAFSGGVDSTLLLFAAHKALGDRAVALTAQSPTFPAREADEAAAFCRQRGIRQVVFETHELEVPEYRRNPVDRCYWCKTNLLGRALEAAQAQGLACVAEGSNVDDAADYRPGSRAVAELGIASPLRDAGLTKAEIRALSREFGLPTADKPSFACLASRFAYGQPIDAEGLAQVDAAEQLLIDRGFAQVRVRVHRLDNGGRLTRIEIPPEDFARLIADGGAARIEEALRGLGFTYVSLDLGGYRTGKMNLTGKQN